MEGRVPSKRRAKRTRERESVKSIAEQISALGGMSSRQLRAEYARVFGESTKTPHRGWLIKKIAWRIQADAEGGLSARAKEQADKLGADAPVRWNRPPPKSKSVNRDPRLPSPGTVLQRKYKGRTYEVTVLRSGFVYDGQEFQSLSAVAKEITGTVWNGLLFFGLKKRGKAPAS